MDQVLSPSSEMDTSVVLSASPVDKGALQAMQTYSPSLTHDQRIARWMVLLSPQQKQLPGSCFKKKCSDKKKRCVLDNIGSVSGKSKRSI